MTPRRIILAALIVIVSFAAATGLGYDGGGAPSTARHQPRGEAGGRRMPGTRISGNPLIVIPQSGGLSVNPKLRKPVKAGILFDVDTGEVLWQDNPNRRLPIASLTKMMTGLLIATRHRPGEMVRISRDAVHYTGSGVGLLPQGRRVSLVALLNGMMLVSGNDAAIALAEHDAGTEGRFVRRMNESAKRLGLRCSRFASSSGIIDRGNYSCPLDLATLARMDLANPWLRKIVSTRNVKLPFPIKGGHLELYNINPFLLRGDPGITGIKTGLTDAAGRCYVITQKIGGHHLGVVLLNSTDPINQVPQLLAAGARAESRQE